MWHILFSRRLSFRSDDDENDSEHTFFFACSFEEMEVEVCVHKENDADETINEENTEPRTTPDKEKKKKNKKKSNKRWLKGAD